MPGGDRFDSSGDLAAGLTIGSYRLIGPLGRGGMSSVYRAVHLGTGHEVAVKILPRSLARDEVLLQRFLREAKSAEALEHPGIAAIFDRGVDEGRHYLVLEYVEGGDFAERVRRGGPLPVEEAAAVVRAAAEALRYASRRGLIHRDIKPANLLRGPGGRVKVIDLGLALHAEHEDERVTRDGTTVGTVDYMAPEQARNSRATSEKSDVYSLGCTLYFLLTAMPPFPGGDITSKLQRHVLDPAPDPRLIRPDIPDWLARLVARMMAKRPEARPDYDGVIDALDAGTNPEPLPLTALVVDDEEEPAGEDEDLLGRLAAAPALTEDFLTGLAASESDHPAAPEAAPLVLPPLAEGETIPLDEAADEEKPAASAGLPPRLGHAIPARNWVATCGLLGLAMVLFVIGVDQIIRATLGTPGASVRAPETPDPRPDATAVAHARPSPAPASPAPRKPAAPEVPEAPDAVAWVEPGDPVAAVLPEVPFPAELERTIVPDWAREAPAEPGEGPVTVVRRVASPEDPESVPSLRRAFDVTGGTIEVADAGPFVEDDFRIAGESRRIRARAGPRPIVRVAPPRNDYLKESPAVIVLEGKRLVLEGIDLVVDVKGLPLARSALFSCKGADLTLRRCTITVLNPPGRPFAIFRTDTADRPSRIRVEESLVRGAVASAFNLAGAPAEVAIVRSAVVVGDGPPFAFQPAGTSGLRDVSLYRSLLAARGPIFDLAPSAATAPADSVRVRSLGSTFARLEGGSPSGLIVSRERRPEAAGHLAWRGESNTFAGWAAWLSAPAAPSAGLAHLDAARAEWADTDRRSVESAAAWPASTDPERATLDDLKAAAPGLRATLSRVAAPAPFLLEKTFEEFARLPGPPSGPTSPTLPGAVTELDFDVAASPWMGDLGRFLRERAGTFGERVRIRVRGSGRPRLSPIRMPEGTSLEIRAEPPGEAGNEPLIWSPAPASPSAGGGALIEVSGGDLILSGFGLVDDGASRLGHLVRVEGGDLSISRCLLASPWGVAPPPGASLVDFTAATTRPRAGPPGPFGAGADRPACRLADSVLIAGGDALSARVARGVVALENCAVAAGGDAVALHPRGVARHRFEADLWLDRCTLLAGRSLVSLGAWGGSPLGPDRPWLVSSKGSAYLDGSQKSPRAAALLRVDPGSLALGAVFWQASRDAYDVAHFLSGPETPQATNLRPDVRRQWRDLWGANHIDREVTGPVLNSRTPAIRTLARSRPGEISPADLVLDPGYYPGRKALDVGADPRRLGLPPDLPARRR